MMPMLLQPLVVFAALRGPSPTARPVVGQHVAVLQKQHYRTGERTHGVVAAVLTRAPQHCARASEPTPDRPSPAERAVPHGARRIAARGFKVRLENGTVGRCVELMASPSVTGKDDVEYWKGRAKAAEMKLEKRDRGASASSTARRGGRSRPRRERGLPDVVRLREENARRQDEIWEMLQRDDLE